MKKKKLYEQLINCLSNIQWERGTQDNWMWIDIRNEYTTKSRYKLENQEIGQNRRIFELLWNIKASQSTLVCIWRAMLDRLPTQQNLIWRGVGLGCTTCPLCFDSEETAKYLFIMCNVVQRVWDNVINGLE